ncbi:D-alpha,beta-D-heptose 7-phosphate 1-kinase /D-beta-D-heptose 1-phosphate adenylyltransferase [Pseudobutyrivibrio sp. 49]|uniref:D-glycero-beta-D-manno-heptose 1-phosphate adenylyltransferase n=1 Tax=Pseudobutyrivibrio sp. 49 TaxID=1855344 RepID=UPI000882F484|nr:D-glycero-beta-D-manno-heptose 1-phosphate adenylyltransferase [Pseudobutyrivibrio sp. 49]SDH91984.1 D-alpha,beta-D-heptose 7-phosphate 1-kinase /D-beta-D-heptose 1-phosphate adenylyltransferase [Pseudobutyrivibrio sp. 49]
MGKKILVVGDAMLDSYHFGDVNRISPEAPVPVFLEKGNRKYSPGGAANVAVNVSAIGVPTVFFAISGNDNYGNILKEQLEDSGIETDYLLVKDDYKTISKLRYIGPGNQQILRVDREDTSPISDDFLDDAFKSLEAGIQDFGLIILSDYLKGFLTDNTTKRIIELANKYGIKTLVDVKDKNVSKYSKATLLKPNRKELAELSGCDTSTVASAVEAAKTLCIKAGCEYVLATLGADGMILVNKDGLLSSIKSVASEVYDVTGAGDTSIAYLAAELVKGTDIEHAMIVANYAAGVQVSKVGTSIVYPDEVCAAMQDDGRSKAAGILDYYHEGGLDPLVRAKDSGKKIVFTNGCFDILHVGHITYLRKAKRLGDILVIGVNSDDSVRRLKGESRPINTCKDRMTILSSLDFVDYVVEFKEDTPAGLIEKIAPDVLVKGGDYKVEEIAGADFVMANGGEVKIIDFVPGKSTTGIVEKMKRS